MYIFTNNSFTGGKEASRALLGRAMEAYQEIADVRPRRTIEDLLSSIETSELGKPYIPGWQHFSISHSENTWTVLFDDYECGIDVQYERNAELVKIAEKCFAQEDLEEAVSGVSEFFRIWTRREAAIKCIGGSVMQHIPSVLEMQIELDGEEHYLFDIELLGTEDGCHAAVCSGRIPLEINYYGL